MTAVTCRRLFLRFQERRFSDAQIYGISSGDVALEAETGFYLALDAFGYRELDAARTWCLRSLDGAANARSFSVTGGNIPLQHVQARTHELLGLIEAAEGKDVDWLAEALKALFAFDKCAVADVYVEAFLLRNLSILATDFDLQDDARTLADRVALLAWTEDVSRVQFTTLEALGWSSALRGDIVEALRLVRRAETVASTVPERVLVGVDRALIARETGHKDQASEEVENALTSADKFRWSEAAGDYRLYAGRRSSRRGSTRRVCGSSAHRVHNLEHIAFEWRAARAALELAEMDAGNVFRLAVKRELHRRPDSLFAERARKVA